MQWAPYNLNEFEKSVLKRIQSERERKQAGRRMRKETRINIEKLVDYQIDFNTGNE